ncbi:MAG: HDOD domain-containing protein [Planctomyces sp.]|nr:HDOD domain-containing protein [Planctomyces sp.]
MTIAVSQNPTIPTTVEEASRLRLKDFNALPAVALQAIEVAKDPNCSLQDFTAMVERDVKIASDLLATANSAMFSGGRAISTLQQAVVRLGLRPCRNLLLTSSMNALAKKLPLHEEWVRECLTRHGFLTAILALHVNRVCAIGFQGEEFAGALVHDFGRSLFSAVFPERFAEIDPMEFDESPETLVHEDQSCGTNHCEFGAWFATQQKFPDELISVIRFHHDPTLAAAKYRRLVALVASCDHMANYLQRFEFAEGYDLAANTAIQILDSCLTKHTLHRLSESLTDVMQMSMRDAMEMMAN